MIPCTRWLEPLRRHLAIARVGRDPEGVHQVRVASARLATWLELASSRTLMDDVRWLRNRAAAVRDLDVLLLTQPPEPWASWLQRRRRDARRDLLAALDDSRLPALIEALSLLPSLPIARARAGRETLRQRAVERGDALLKDASSPERLHALRRALRRLRYADDWMQLDSARLKALQDAFGSLNDLAVAQQLLAEYPRRALLAPLAADLESRFEDARCRALAAWGSTRHYLEQPAHALRPAARPSRRSKTRPRSRIRRKAPAHVRGRGRIR